MKVATSRKSGDPVASLPHPGPNSGGIMGMTPQERMFLACCYGVLGGGGNEGGGNLDVEGLGAVACVTETIGWQG